MCFENNLQSSFEKYLSIAKEYISLYTYIYKHNMLQNTGQLMQRVYLSKAPPIWINFSFPYNMMYV